VAGYGGIATIYECSATNRDVIVATSALADGQFIFDAPASGLILAQVPAVADASLPSADSGSGCFITAAASGSSTQTHSTLLSLPDALKHILLKIYEKYSPPLVHLVARHYLSKATVHISLWPLVAVREAARYFGCVVALAGLVVASTLAMFSVWSHRRKALGYGMKRLHESKAGSSEP